MTSALPISIAGRRVGPDAPVYFIAEAGSNHDGNIEQAKRLVDVAVEAGADAVKFQAFKAATLYPKRAGRSEYLKDTRSIYDIIRSLEMPLDWIAPLATYCEERGIHFLCTPFDDRSADAMAPYVPAFKLASYDMTNYPLLQHVARKGKPLIVSTGTAEMSEVREMVAAVRAVGSGELVVLQCTAKYPAPLSALNVRAVATMATEMGVLTGFSDHSREPLAGPMAAVALGAVVIEKHFTLSNRLPGPDHPYALEPAELKELIAKVRQVEATLGSGQKIVQGEELELRSFARRTIFTTREIVAGDRLRRADLAILRCGTLPYGLHPKECLSLFGRTVTRSLDEESTVRHEDLSDLTLQDGNLTLRLMLERDAAQILKLPRAGRGYAVNTLRADRLDFVVSRAGAAPTGHVAIVDVDLVADRADLEIAFAESQDLAEAHRACSLVIDHAFGTLGLEELRVVAETGWIRELARGLGSAERAGHEVLHR